MSTLGERIHRLRKKRGYTLSELQERANVSKSYIHDIEKGKRQSPSLSILQRLAEALGIPLEQLINYNVDNKYWLADLPPDLQQFVRDSSNIKYVELSKKMKEANIDPETVEKILEILKQERDR